MMYAGQDLGRPSWTKRIVPYFLPSHGNLAYNAITHNMVLVKTLNDMTGSGAYDKDMVHQLWNILWNANEVLNKKPTTDLCAVAKNLCEKILFPIARLVKPRNGKLIYDLLKASESYLTEVDLLEEPAYCTFIYSLDLEELKFVLKTTPLQKRVLTSSKAKKFIEAAEMCTLYDGVYVPKGYEIFRFEQACEMSCPQWIQFLRCLVEINDLKESADANNIQKEHESSDDQEAVKEVTVLSGRENQLRPFQSNKEGNMEVSNVPFVEDMTDSLEITHAASSAPSTAVEKEHETESVIILSDVGENLRSQWEMGHAREGHGNHTADIMSLESFSTVRPQESLTSDDDIQIVYDSTTLMEEDSGQASNEIHPHQSCEQMPAATEEVLRVNREVMESLIRKKAWEKLPQFSSLKKRMKRSTNAVGNTRRSNRKRQKRVCLYCKLCEGTRNANC